MVRPIFLSLAAVLLALTPLPGRTQAGDGLLPPGAWTPSQRTELLDLISSTEAALPTFADASTLPALGFHNFGIAAPGGYVHFINNAWLDDGHTLDPTHPEALLFQEVYDPSTHSSRLDLKAAMFMLPTGTTMNDIPADIAWMPGWHVHPDVCVTDDLRFADLADVNGSCHSGHPMLGPPMLHVWITDNGCGDRFSMVDVGGLMCEMHMPDDSMPHDSMPHDSMPHDSMPMDSMPHHSMPMTTAPPSVAPTAGAAAPVRAVPTFTG